MTNVRRTGEKPAETWRSCSPDTLRMLRERVAGLQGPDRETDGAIMEALKHPIPEDGWGSVWPDHVTWDGLEHFWPPLTASIDAAIGLVERLLPVPKHWAKGSPPSSGWKIGLYRGMTPSGAPYASWECFIRLHGEAERSILAPTAPLAIILALLDTLLASQDSTHD